MDKKIYSGALEEKKDSACQTGFGLEQLFFMTNDFNPVFTLETGVSSWEDDFLSTQDTDEDAVFRKIQVLDQHSGSTISARNDHLTMFDGSRF